MSVKRSEPRQAILLSGMYRSGTSAASRALSFLGFAQPQLLVEAGPANPKGFWEASRIAGDVREPGQGELPAAGPADTLGSNS